MAEDTDLETTVLDDADDQTTEPNVMEFLDETGAFKEGYLDALVPEDLRGSKVYGTAKDIRALLKLAGHQARQIGKQGKGVLPLGDSPTETDLAMYRQGMGIPETPEGYNFEVPEGLAEQYDDKMVKEMLATFHAANLSPVQVKAIVDLDAKWMREGTEENAKAAGAAKKETEAVLRDEWGQDYAANLALANRVVAERIPEGDREDVLAAIGNDPRFIRLFADLGRAYLEDVPIMAEANRRDSMAAEIERLRAEPGYADGKMKREERDKITARLNLLYQRQYPEQKSAP